MNEKFKNPENTVDFGAGVPGNPGPHRRRVDLPAELTESELAGLPSAEISARIIKHGAAVGLAAMAKLAAAHGDTPAGTQFLAAKFLQEEASRLAEAEKLPAGVAANGLRALGVDQLTILIDLLQARKLGQTEAIEAVTIPD